MQFLRPLTVVLAGLCFAISIAVGVAQDKPQVDGRTAKYVASQFGKYDANKDGKLQQDEWKDLQSTALIDLDQDKVITQDELTQRQLDMNSMGRKKADEKAKAALAAKGGGEAPAGVAAQPDPAGKPPGEGPKPGEAAKGAGGAKPSSSAPPARRYGNRKSFRAKTPTERLPTGLPDFFTRADINGDGQVSMAEFSSRYTDEKAKEFAKYDLNRDGLITPREALKAPK